MAHQVAGYLGDRVVLSGEDLLPCLEHRIVGIPGVQFDGAIVRIDGRLDRVADVVGLLRTQRLDRVRRLGGGILRDASQIGHLRIRVGVRRGVAVDDPLDPSVHHRRVHAAVQRQVRGDLGDALLGGTVVQDLRVGGDTVGEQDLIGSEPDRVQKPREDVAHRGAAIAVKRIGRALRSGRIVELPRIHALRSPDNRVFWGVRGEVDARLVLLRFGELALGGDAGFEELRLPVRRHLVAVCGHDTVPMRIHGVVVDPVAVVVAFQIQFSGGDHRVLADAVDVVLVDGQRVGERVVLLRLLQLLERGADDLWVEQSDLRGGFGLGRQRSGLALGGGLVLFDLHLVEPVRLLRGVDVALDIGGFHLLRVRVHLEPLQQHRPCDGEHQRDDQRGGDRNHRRTPRLESRGGADTRLGGAFQRMGVHQPHAEEHTEHRGDGRHDERDRNGRVHGGVCGAGDAVALLGQMREHADHLARGPGQHVEDQPDADLATGALGHSEHSATMHRHGEADAAHHRMRDDGEHNAHQQQHRYGRHHQPQTGQHKHIEPVVDAELRIGSAEALRVEHQQDLRPVRVELRAEHHAHDQRHDHGGATRGLGTERLAHFDDVVLDAERRAVGRIGASVDSQPSGHIADQGHQQRIRRPQAELDTQLGPHHVLKTELSVPHQVRDELRQAEEQADDDNQRQHDADQNLRPLAGPVRQRSGREPRHAALRRLPLAGGWRLAMIVAIRLHIDDHRIVIGRTGVPTWPAWPVAGIEHTQHIKKRHDTSLSKG